MADLFWIKILCPAWSFLVNCGYWLVNFKNLGTTKKKKKKYYTDIKGLADVKKCLCKVKWKKDNLKDWRPWVITMIHKKFVDDCDGAAVLANFLFSILGVKGRILSLRGKTGHAIYLSNARQFMTDNSIILSGFFSDADILDHFKGRYTKIIR